MEFDNKNTIVNFSNSIIKHFGIKEFHNTIPKIDEVLKGHKKVVVLLFDGFGEYIQDVNKECCKYIIDKRIHVMNATFPPTTVASTTGFMTARFPIETGWMSWVQYIKEENRNIEVFKNKDALTKEAIAPRNNLILDKYCPRVFIKGLINDTKGKTVAYDMNYFGDSYHGPKNLTIARWKLNKLIRSQKDEFFMYYYYESPDHDIHEFGTEHKKVKRIIKKINHFTKKLTRKHKDTLFLLIADHGLLNTTSLLLNEHEDFYNTLNEKLPYTMEKRSIMFFIKEGQKENFETLFNKYYGEHFELFTRQEVLEKKIFGEGEAHPKVQEFLGDYFAISKDEYTFDDPRENSSFKPIARHAGGTLNEMKIAVSAFNK